MRHNEIRDITAKALCEVCKDVETEPLLSRLSGERFHNRTAIVGDKARLGISANGVWIKGQKEFFDVRVFNHNASRYINQTLKKNLERNETEKKRNYNQRILEVENGSFTPLVFSANGAMGRECQKFYNRLCELIAEKRNIEISSVTSWLRTTINFSLIRSMLLCVRGSRNLRRKDIDMNEIDIDLVNITSNIRDE